MHKINYTLQPAQQTDFDFLFALNKITMYDHVVKTYGPWDEQWQIDFFKKQFKPSEYSIIMKEGKPAGTLALKTVDDTIHIDRLQIMPEFQSQGIGSAILDDLIIESKARGTRLTLQVFKTNNRAKDLYSKNGFVVTSESKERYFMSL